MSIFFNSVWQAAVLGIVMWVLIRLALRTNAVTRYFAWFSTLCASLLFPVLTTPHGMALALPREMLTIAPIAWAVGAGLLLLRIGVGIASLSYMKRIALPLDPAVRDSLTEWKGTHLRHRDLRVCVSDRLDVPVAVGLFDAAIILPEWAVRSLPPSDIERLLQHEIAHLRRYDDWAKLLQNIVRAMLFFNPAVPWISAQVDLEREVACDECAAEREEDRTRYASCLSYLARASALRNTAFLAPGIIAQRKSLTLRVERLLQPREVQRGVPTRTAIACAVVLAALFVGLQALSPIATQAVSLPQDEPAARAHAFAIYDDLRVHRHSASGFTSAQRALAELGPITQFTIRHANRTALPQSFEYSVETASGRGTMHVQVDEHERITAFTILAVGSTPQARSIKAYISTEPDVVRF